MAASSPKVRRPISNEKRIAGHTLPQRAPGQAPLRGGVGTKPPHPPFEGEGGRGRDHAARGAPGAAKIPIVNLPLLGGSRTNYGE